MDPARWRRIERLFLDAREQQGDERTRLLDTACSDDPDLRAEVEALLQAADEAGAFLEDDPRRAAWSGLFEEMVRRTAGEPPPGRIGPYRILRPLGRGGMGAVYLAERDDDPHRPVALKVIRRGLDTEDVLRRFRHEREVLARLDHPYIARLYDAGTTADGRPYFAMEYVEGEALLDYCDARDLHFDERLRLFEQVCQAVQHAHARLVLHRDLKPSNILVTTGSAPGEASGPENGEAGPPEVRLLDFGVAKSLEPDGDAATLTATLYRILTPQYASPEQVRGHALTTASDVYQLGVVLYELLAGASPYAVTGRSTLEVERAVCHTLPLPPSQAAYERLRERDPKQAARCRRALRGDLDAIVLKALEKRPEDRYATAELLRTDVQRYLRGEPLVAQRATWRYPLRRLARRASPYLKHAAAVTILGLAVVVAALLYGPIDRNPVRAELEGEYLRLLNARGREVDHIRLPAGSSLTHLTISPAEAVSLSTAFIDLDDDGRNEFVWGQHPSNLLSASAPASGQDAYIAAWRVGEDEPLWRLPLHFDVVYPRKPGTRTRQFVLSSLIAGDYDGDGLPVVFAAVGSANSFASLILKVDARYGRVIERYVHPGRLDRVTAVDLDGDGVREILAAGTSNALSRDGVLAVLDPHAIEGHAPQAGDYRVGGFVPASHVAYLRFPRTILRELLLETQSNVVTLRTNPAQDEINLMLHEGDYTDPVAGNLRLGLLVFLSRDLRVRDVNTMSAYDVVAEKLHREGHLATLPGYDYWEAWKRQVRYWTGDDWRTAGELDSLGLSPLALATPPGYFPGRR